MRMTKRTEERLQIAKAKENLWRQHRGQGEMKTGEEDAWETLREKIMELEEGGTWREIGKETSMMKASLQNLKEPNRDDGVREGIRNVLEIGGTNDGVRSEVENGMKIGNDMEVGDDHGGVGDEVEMVKDVLEVGGELEDGDEVKEDGHDVNDVVEVRDDRGGVV